MSNKIYRPEDCKINLISSEKTEVEGRGIVFIIDLKKNNLPQKRKEFFPLLKEALISVDGFYYTVLGIESFTLHDDSPHNKIGLQVKQWGLWHPISKETLEAYPYKPYNKGQFKLENGNESSQLTQE